MPNRLVNEISPYLRQHADNPVDWYPWGREALEKAHQEDKPIFLSIGYAACHWCHVMAHESFEDAEVAAILNAHFVPVKVDREERPDLDAIYIQAVQMLVGSAGWPLSVFLTPDGRPFFGGTYFPPTPRYGMPAFRDVLLAVARTWRERRAEILEGSKQIVEHIRHQMAPSPGREGLDMALLERAVSRLQAEFDPVYGGWGEAPRFPQPMVLEFLLRRHVAGDGRALPMVTHTLEAMARGGLYDQLGGGFHRYSVDRRWLVPHFEKMLYDNAQLARVYLHACKLTDNPLFRAVAEETLDFMLREMGDPAGGFYATLDADSEGEEGKFYLWTASEIRAVLGPDADQFSALYGVTTGGNFDGRNILTFAGGWEEREATARLRQTLQEVRERRARPARDEKVVVAWNGLALAAFADGARLLERADYRAAAERNADFLLAHLRRPDGRLWHIWRDGQAKGEGFLDDYTHLIDGLLALYEATFNPRWYNAAAELAEVVRTHFAAPVGFYDTADHHETLIVRPRNLQDNAIPSGNAMAAFVFLRLAGLAANPGLAELARQGMAEIGGLAARYPLAFGQWLVALDYALSDPWEIAVVGALEGKDTQVLLGMLAGYRPHQVLAAGAPGSPVPLLANRPLAAGRATVYLCRGGVCQAPITEPEDLAGRLQAAAAMTV
ncbi:MAG: thioredoxin domain-containing protein [Anaerolineae bacterium]|nr:thioredoxin domain-containing protein [Anaerolineae bacterium]